MLSNLGRPDEPTALMHNPAGLADQPGVQLYLFLSPTFLSFDMSMEALDAKRFPDINPAGCGNPGAAPCPWPIDGEGYYTQKIQPEKYFGILPYLGVTTDLSFISPSAQDVVVSLALYAPNFYGAYFPQDAPTAYGFIEGMFMVGAATAGVGWRIHRTISVGASISYHYMQLSLSKKLSMADVLTKRGEEPEIVGILAQQALGDLRLEFSGVDHGVGWGLGALISPLPWLHFGLAYNGSSAAHFHGEVAFTSSKKDEETFLSLVKGFGYKLPQRLTIQMTIPHALSVGVNAALGRQVEIGVDCRFWLYNLYERQVITPHYDPDAPGKEPISEDSLSQNKNYHLSYQLTGGVLVRPIARLPQVELMAGVGYDHSPIPDETLTLDNPSLSHVKVTAGVRWQIDHHWRLSLTYLFVYFIPRDITTSQTHPPTNVRGSGHTHSPALALTYRF